MKKQKRGLSNLAWILIVLGVIALGILVYFLVFGGNASIPQPPALPN